MGATGGEVVGPFTTVSLMPQLADDLAFGVDARRASPNANLPDGRPAGLS